MNNYHTNYVLAVCENNVMPNLGFIVPEKALKTQPRRGQYPQCRAYASWLMWHTVSSGKIADPWYFTGSSSTGMLKDLEMLHDLNDDEWKVVQCINVWDFFEKIGYDYKKKKYVSPLDLISLLG